ncbi:MAG: CapA family protein [Deltaproteobacteria bacterium]|nr:CapA family protein [Deltaproteobacteria bacterium]
MSRNFRFVAGRQRTALYLLLLAAAGCATAPRPSPEPQAPASATPPPERVPGPAPHPVSAAPQAAGPTAELLGSVTFAATGDIMAHGEVKKAAAAADGGWDALYAPIAPVIGPADIAFGNLETPVAPDHDHGSRPFIFNAPPEMLAALKRAGFKVVLFANNHAYDQDRDGFAESLDRIDASGLKEVGAGRTREAAQAPLRMEVNGVKLAWFGAAQFFNDLGPGHQRNVDDPKQPMANLIDGPAMVAAIAKVRPEVDAVIVSVHWGVEYMEAPRQSEIDLAHQLFEAGADVIIGSHPHVLQPIEVYRAKDGRTCLCLYSLGNFISNQNRQYLPHAQPDKMGDSRDGAIVEFTLEKRRYGPQLTALNLAGVKYVPLWTDNNFFRPKDQAVDIHPIVIDVALRQAHDELEAAEKAAGPKPSKEAAAHLIALKQRIELLELRRKRIVGRLGEDFSGDP